MGINLSGKNLLDEMTEAVEGAEFSADGVDALRASVNGVVGERMEPGVIEGAPAVVDEVSQRIAAECVRVLLSMGFKVYI